MSETDQVANPAELMAITERMSPDLVRRVQDLFENGIDTTHLMDGFDQEDFILLTSSLVAKRFGSDQNTEGLLDLIRSGRLSYENAVSQLREYVYSAGGRNLNLKAFDTFESERDAAREKRKTDRWSEIDKEIGYTVATTGYAIEYSLNRPIVPDQEDWLGEPYNPPLDPISTSTMRVYLFRNDLIHGLREHQEKGDNPLSVDGLAERITPHFYHQNIGDLTNRRDERLAGLEIRLPPDAIALYEELEALSVDAQESPLEVSQGLAEMLSQIEGQILPHAVDSLSEVRSFFPSGETQ